MTSNPITAGLRQETDVPLDDDCIADTHIYYYVFLDHIRNRRKLVQSLGNNRQEWSIEIEQNHMVVSGGIENREMTAVMATW